ncbi:MAG: Rieske 2Fe-2S domain-containing protein [Chloroflexi bacterium]|nr:Rieske 2Fe-2S domain-containing protein [Chloroflexota bacterium]
MARLGPAGRRNRRPPKRATRRRRLRSPHPAQEPGSGGEPNDEHGGCGSMAELRGHPSPRIVHSADRATGASRRTAMLTREKNELLTRVGPGQPAGELLRRYWHPVCPVQELSSEQPTRFVRILGEDLVLFLDKSGRAGLIQDHCSNRGASLLYGRVEERGIACAYHGWLYDTQGSCLETPAEPADSNFYLTVRIRAYPVQRFVGLYWAYLGPEPAPVIPKYDVWVRKDGRRDITVHPRLDCNWLHPQPRRGERATTSSEPDPDGL